VWEKCRGLRKDPETLVIQGASTNGMLLNGGGFKVLGHHRTCRDSENPTSPLEKDGFLNIQGVVFRLGGKGVLVTHLVGEANLRR